MIALAVHLSCWIVGCDTEADEVDVSSTPTSVAAQTESPVVAVVNDREITNDEVQARLSHIEELYRNTQRPFDNETRAAKRQEVIQRLVDRELLRHHLAESDIEVDPDVVDEKVQRRIDTEFGSTAAFHRYLDSEDLTVGDFRERLREETRLKQLIAQDVDRDEIDEQKLRNHYERIANRRPADDRVRASTVSVEFPRSIDGDTRRQLRAMISEQLDDHSEVGSPVELQARLDEISTDLDPSISTRTGAPRWFERNQLRPRTARVLFADDTLIDRPSDIIDTATGVQTYWIHDRRGAGIRGFDEVENLLRDRAYRSQIEKRRRELVQQLRSDATISIRPSDEPPLSEIAEP